MFYEIVIRIEGGVQIRPCEFSDRRKVRFSDTNGRVTYYATRSFKKSFHDRVATAVMRHAKAHGVKPRSMRYFR